MFSHVAKSSAKASQRDDTAVQEATGSDILPRGNYSETDNSVLRALVKQIATIMAMGEGKVGLGAQTADLGLDSLIAVELKNWSSAQN